VELSSWGEMRMNNFWVRFRRNLLSDEGLGLIAKVIGHTVGFTLSVAFYQWLGAPLWAAAMGTFTIWSINRLVWAAQRLERRLNDNYQTMR
jgi:Flp pilus assembly protein TadB